MWGRHLVCRLRRHPAASNTGHGCPVNRQAGSLTHILRRLQVRELITVQDGRAGLLLKRWRRYSITGGIMERTMITRMTSVKLRFTTGQLPKK